MARFGDEVLDDIRSRTNLFGLISSEVKLEGNGKAGEYKGLCPFHSEKSASFTVSEPGGFFHCFGCGAHGDCFSFLVNYYTEVSFPVAVATLAQRAGVSLPGDHNQKINLTPLPRVERPSGENLTKEREEKIKLARRIWFDCRPMARTMVEGYLEGRGLDLYRLPQVKHVLRFHGRMMYGQGSAYPAMVAAVQLQEGDHRRIVGIHRTYLEAKSVTREPLVHSALQSFPNAKIVEGPQMVVTKAPVGSPKKMLGPCNGGAVRFAPAAESLCIAEGIETALSVMQATGRATWAALSLGGMASVVLPKQVKEVILCADSDAKDKEAADKALLRAAEHHRLAGREVRIAHAGAGQDFNDMLVEGEENESKEHID